MARSDVVDPRGAPASSSAGVSSTATPAVPKSLAVRHHARSARSLWLLRHARDKRIEVTPDALVLHPSSPDEGPSEAVPWRDVLGAAVLDAQGRAVTVDGVTADNAPTAPTDGATESGPLALVIHACPVTSITGDAPPRRQRKLERWVFRFAPQDLELAADLQLWINYLADPRSVGALTGATGLEDLAPVVYAPRRFLIVINPVGGSGGAEQMYETQVAPMLAAANITATVQCTERAEHTIEIAETMPLGVYDCVVAVGGDGSVCELFQGFMRRPDWQAAIEQPTGVIPGGSANGLFCAVMHDAGEDFEPRNGAFVLAKGHVRPLDLTAVRNPHGEWMYSFLSTSWAFLADMDVESEKFRFLGQGRFTVSAVKLLFFCNRRYDGAIWYLEETDAQHPTEPTPHAPRDADDRPGFTLFEGLADGAPAPDGSAARWTRLEDRFHLAWVVSVSHAAPDAHIVPGALLDDGYTYILLVDSTMPKLNVAKMLLTMENGAHMDRDYIKVLKTRAFKFHPDDPEAVMCVDGERFRGPIEAQVHRNLARIVSLPPVTTTMAHAKASAKTNA